MIVISTFSMLARLVQLMLPNGDGMCRTTAILPPKTHKDRNMNTKVKLVNPAVMATLLVFAGSTSTAPAMADDHVAFDTSEASSEQIEEISKEQAKQANETAVEEAARAVEADTQLDLDIKLIGRTSVRIAGEVLRQTPRKTGGVP